MLLEQDVNNVCYFWEERGDLERCTSWPEIRKRLAESAPEVAAAWDNYKIAMRTLSAVVRDLSSRFNEQESGD